MQPVYEQRMRAHVARDDTLMSLSPTDGPLYPLEGAPELALATGPRLCGSKSRQARSALSIAPIVSDDDAAGTDHTFYDEEPSMDDAPI